ncbi:MAG: DUF58 domain-containing protein [Planctomycetaceae bacterium]
MRWIFGAIVLLLIGIALDLGLLVYSMYALLSVLLVSRYLAREWTDHLSVTRSCSRTTAEIGEKTAVIVEIKNEGRLTIPWLLIEDSLPREALRQRPPRIKIERKRRGLFKVRGGSTVSLRYQLIFQMRGYYQIGPTLVESGDLFGLHRRYRILSEPAFVLVYPKVIPLTGYDLASRRPIGEVRMTHRLFEDPTRISGVRPYQTGDALNRIHWQATARTGDLHSKTYEPSTVAGATILLDFFKDDYVARHEPARSELAVTACASMANAVYQMGQQVGFMTNARDAADRIREEGYQHDFLTRDAAQKTLGMVSESDRLRPVIVETRRGADQLTRILESLARAEMTDGLTFPQFVMEVANRIPRDTTVVAVLPQVSTESALALGSLKRRGFAVTVLLVMFEEEEEFPESMGRLIAEGIDVRRVDSEEAISHVCSAQCV